MNIEIKEFGPINKGIINLKPLTILIGPNSSGKSYTAMLIHTLFNVLSRLNINDRSFETFYRDSYLFYRYHEDELNKNKKSFDLWFTALYETKKVTLDNAFVNEFSYKFLDNLLNTELINEIRRSFSADIKDLIRAHKRGFEVNITNNGYGINLRTEKINANKKKSIPKFILSNIKTFDYQLNFEVVNDHKTFYKLDIDNETKIVTVYVDRMVTFDKEIFYRIISSVIISVYINIVLGKNIGRSLYLPAARSGILQAHKSLSARIIEKASYAGIQDFEVPKLTGVVSDFITSMLELNDTKSKVFSLTKRFEKFITNGEVLLKDIGRFQYPELKYVNDDIDIPLHRASSTISELAPIFLYFKYKVKDEDLVVIEEPEAHLHPNNQRLLARFIVKLIRNNVKLLLTTHSDYLLEQINSFILLANVSNEDRIKKFNYEEDDFINANEVSSFVFHYNQQSKGFKIDEVMIDNEEGIMSEEFLKVYESLNEESIKLNRELI